MPCSFARPRGFFRLLCWCCRWLALALPALSSGCLFPYRVVYRPKVAGVVDDGAGRPVAGVNVVACSASHFADLQRDGCKFSAAAVTGADGRFAFESARGWEWFELLPHEAPLPFTLVSACAPDGRVGGVKLDPGLRRAAAADPAGGARGARTAHGRFPVHRSAGRGERNPPLLPPAVGAVTGALSARTEGRQGLGGGAVTRYSHPPGAVCCTRLR